MQPRIRDARQYVMPFWGESFAKIHGEIDSLGLFYNRPGYISNRPSLLTICFSPTSTCQNPFTLSHPRNLSIEQIVIVNYHYGLFRFNFRGVLKSPATQPSLHQQLTFCYLPCVTPSKTHLVTQRSIPLPTSTRCKRTHGFNTQQAYGPQGDIPDHVELLR